MLEAALTMGNEKLRSYVSKLREDWVMVLPRMEPELLEHLRVEFGMQGERAADFFETARQYLQSPPSQRCRIGKTAAD